MFGKSRADLSGIAPVQPGGNLYVGKALQGAYVKVDERGTEAAAATTADLKIIEGPPPPQRFNADRPFMFVIYDEHSGLILFLGGVSDPAA